MRHRRACCLIDAFPAGLHWQPWSEGEQIEEAMAVWRQLTWGLLGRMGFVWTFGRKERRVGGKTRMLQRIWVDQ